MMNFHVMTLFPDMINNAMSESITGRAIKAGHIATGSMIILMEGEPGWLCRQVRFTGAIRL